MIARICMSHRHHVTNRYALSVIELGQDGSFLLRLSAEEYGLVLQGI